jgi:hypothetical protein
MMGLANIPDENDFTPKPNYWAALLWHRFMGPTVLDTGVPIQPGLHLYAHCLPGSPGGVSLLAVNNDRSTARTLTLPAAAERYTLDAAPLDSGSVRLNGQPLALGPDNALPKLAGTPMQAGDLTLAPATISFLTVPTAANPACG